jgi:tetratricopeptide (TPR) repeat protein
MKHPWRIKALILWLVCCLAPVGAIAEPAAESLAESPAESLAESPAESLTEKLDDESFIGSLAAIQEQNREFDASQASYLELLKLIEERDGPYSDELIEPLTGLGRVNLEQARYEEAEPLFRRAQHLSHRAEGVHTPRQKEIIDLLTRIHMELDQPLEADRQQSFSLYISEKLNGKDSTALLPALYKIAEWYLETGQFSRSRKMYEKAADIIKAHDGDQDVKLVEALRGIARTRQLQGICCSHRPLLEVLNILKAQGDTQPVAMAHAMAELADGYSISKKGPQALELYRQAWLTLQNEPEGDRRENLFHRPEQIAMSKIERYPTPQVFTIAPFQKKYRHHISDPTTDFDPSQKTRQVIGVPVQFLYEQLKQILPSALHDPETLAQLFIELEFTVREDGNVVDIVIAATNAPNKLIRTMKQAMSKSRFRPRVQEGVPIETKNVQLTQVFK